MEGHPANHGVLLRVARADARSPEDVVAPFGGQGTPNVNSRAPDSRRSAYVDHPLEDT